MLELQKQLWWSSLFGYSVNCNSLPFGTQAGREAQCGAEWWWFHSPGCHRHTAAGLLYSGFLFQSCPSLQQIHSPWIPTFVCMGMRLDFILGEEEHRMIVSENKAPKKICWPRNVEVIKDWRQLHKRDFYNLCL
jgi:hypothetical protein